MKQVFIGGSIILFGIGGWWLLPQSHRNEVVVLDEKATTELAEGDTLDTSDDVSDNQVLGGNSETNQDLEIDMGAEVPSGTRGSYQTYSPAALAASTATHNVLIFSATWCPSCRALDADITKNIADLPGNVALFTIDYDTNTALRQQYNVTTQHTLVLVETDGTTITSWRGGNTLTSILSNL